ncbi:MAG: replicative DNA helicase, partial [Oscillospiraceae bacterium]|nr:replicative DNA helicase [Oscillospiraceae bacterium]
MPHSREAEQAVLGSILIDSRCAPQVISALKPGDFYTELNRGIYEVICSMFNFARPIDAVTVLDEMKLQGIYNAQSSQSYLIELMNVTPTAANVMRYVEIVRDKALLRGIATVASEITAAVNEGTGAGE